jgi:hypothetical protein
MVVLVYETKPTTMSEATMHEIKSSVAGFTKDRVRELVSLLEYLLNIELLLPESICIT